MPISVSKEEYLDAVDRALEIARKRPEPRPAGVKAVVAFLAWVYDMAPPPLRGRPPHGTLDLLTWCDDETVLRLLTIIAGRLRFGRLTSEEPSDLKTLLEVP